jgi:hypothetical protein
MISSIDGKGVYRRREFRGRGVRRASFAGLCLLQPDENGMVEQPPSGQLRFNEILNEYLVERANHR